MNQPTHEDISEVVRKWLPQYADGFRMAASGKMLLKTPEAMLCREGMLREVVKACPGVTLAQLSRATGLSDPVIRDTLKRIGEKESDRVG